jgi:serine/threonine-protein kinase
MASDRSAQRTVGRYVLFDEIASGGMAAVHVGRLLGPVGFARTVAIKRLHPQFAKDPEFVSMFLDEARLAARIRHPNVVATLDVVAISGELFLVMDYVHGVTVSSAIKRANAEGKRIPVDIAVSIISGALYGLHAAHEARAENNQPLDIVHRDVSPQNIMVSDDGVASVLDFGIAKASIKLQITRTGAVKGKFAYMAPEQLYGEATRRSDIYSAAVVLWEMVVGKRMFEAPSHAGLALMVLQGNRVAPDTLVDDLPTGLSDIVMKALATKPEDRFETAHDMAVALEHVVPLASPRRVGEWVKAVAGDLLEASANVVTAVESNETPVFAFASSPPPKSQPTVCNTVVDSVNRPKRPTPSNSEMSSVEATTSPTLAARRRAPLAIAIAAVGLLFLAGIAVTLVSRGRMSTTGTLLADVSTTDARSAASAMSATSTESPEPGTEALTAASTSASPSSNAPTPIASTSAPKPRKHRPKEASESRAASASKRTSKPQQAPCNPPYYLDKDGIRHLIPSCL